jgi:hypothetical protein
MPQDWVKIAQTEDAARSLRLRLFILVIGYPLIWGIGWIADAALDRGALEKPEASPSITVLQELTKITLTFQFARNIVGGNSNTYDYLGALTATLVPFLLKSGFSTLTAWECEDGGCAYVYGQAAPSLREGAPVIRIRASRRDRHRQRVARSCG